MHIIAPTLALISDLGKLEKVGRVKCHLYHILNSSCGLSFKLITSHRKLSRWRMNPWFKVLISVNLSKLYNFISTSYFQALQVKLFTQIEHTDVGLKFPLYQSMLFIING
jgi:hypothetical protein